MTNTLITSFSTSGIMDFADSLFHSAVGTLENFLFTADKIHVLSLTLTAVILVSLFFGVIFIFTKICSFLFGKKTSGKTSLEAAAAELPEEVSDFESESDLEFELESELAKNTEAVSAEQTQKEKDAVQFQEEVYEEIVREHSPKNNKNSLIELDWQKSRNPVSPIQRSQSAGYAPANIRKSIHELIGMIVNMLGRHIDELKIAQTLMYRCKDDLSEETVLQLVLSIKEFLVLCQQGAFNNVRKLKDLPSEEDCILQLIAGDTSYAMALLEALMDEKINQAINLKNPAQRNMLFKQSSNYACYFGTLAELNDKNLAGASFELAVEMYPENTLAWSRCADLYKYSGQEDKANWAYHNVLKMARKDRDISQEANACKFLSQYLYAKGESSQASELYLQSKNYYDSIGINRPLDRKELEIIELIDRSNTDSILSSVLPRNQNYM